MGLIITEDYNAMCRKAASIMAAQITLKPDSVLGLATGSTPIGIYGLLTEWYQNGELDFSQITTVNLDEYYGLAPNHIQSYNYFMTKHFFSKVNLLKGRQFLPDGTNLVWADLPTGSGYDTAAAFRCNRCGGQGSSSGACALSLRNICMHSKGGACN